MHTGTSLEGGLTPPQDVPIRARLGRWIESSPVQNVIIGVILLNALTLGLETSPTVMAQAGPLLETAERIILAIFVVEIGLKLLAFGGGFFRSAWNVFDFVIVGMSLVPAAGPLSVLRTLRVLRVLRLLRTVPRLRLIIEGVLRVLPDMGWVLALLLLMFYVFSVMGTKLFGAEFPVLFGNLGATMFTLFQTMTLESWATGVARPVMERYPYAFIYFVSFLLITTFLILNMVIGVVVTGFQGVLQGVEAPPGVPPHPKEPHLNLEGEIAQLHRKLDALLARQEERAG
jgi:voltage-gated sodium channel